ncbi:methionyl-tRNA synthetase [Haloactinopolyspora alba]|uniref:Methionine--tRNA ligase n=1 Tax=Haloactinopolyspora alba TaxID=648780 RepID=A0A2P8E5A5_9ACTN|nr:methionine--tRNA ligase [Haloactinopolyspora alba]PSL04649.1 methionyl-tRNA synthetase [Haloactinopolyspora alba]
MPEPSAKAFYVTTPIYYVNDAPHIGHAYTTVVTDFVARWHRQRQESVWFLTGTDEHGEKVLRTAEANGVDARVWADRLVETAWKPVLETIDASNDDFIRTTEPRHVERVKEFIQGLHDAGEIFEGTYEGAYCVACEEYKQPGDLIDGTGEYAGQKLCAIHGRPVEMLAEKNYFFRMSAYTERLLAFYEENPGFIEPESARNEVVSFVKQGLQDLSISRSTFDWGVGVPWDSSHVIYVWVDALLNYATAVGYGADDDAFRGIWPPDVQFVGKDILRFHAVIWPAMLMAAGLPLPKQVFAHGWLLVGGEKMSKSKLTGIAPSDIIDTFGSDAFRYYFLRAIAFGNDGSFSWEDIAARYQAELANGLGNLASRVTAMVGKYFDGVLPEPGPDTDAERRLSEVAERAAAEADAAVGRVAPHEALAAVWTLVEAANGYITEQQPWAVAKDESRRDRLASILYSSAEALRALAVLLNAAMPKSSAALWASLGAEKDLGALDEQPVADAGRWGQLVPGATVTKGAALFPRFPE